MTAIETKRVTKNSLIALAALALLLSLSACSSVKKELGVGRNSPDEFTVVKRAPLSLPPDYDLRPPSANAVPAAGDEAAQTKAALLGAAPAATETAASDTAFLQKLGAANPDANVRDEINRDNGFLAIKNRTVADKLIFWDKDSPSEDKIPASVVDPAAEAARIKQNETAGKPVNDGTVPVIEKQKSTLDKIF